LDPPAKKLSKYCRNVMFLSGSGFALCLQTLYKISYSYRSGIYNLKIDCDTAQHTASPHFSPGGGMIA
jgi:hypothetical protein